MTHCHGCGTELPPKTWKGRDRKWCSERCRKQTLYAGACVDCGASTNGYDGPGKASQRCVKCNGATSENRARTSARFKGKTDWTNEQLLDALRETAVDGKVTATAYRRARNIPRAETIVARFGSWNDAVKAAGLRPGKRVRDNYVRASVQECIAAVAACILDTGRQPSVGAYQTWSRDRSVPCATIIRRRCGGWLAALEMAASTSGAVDRTSLENQTVDPRAALTAGGRGSKE